MKYQLVEIETGRIMHSPLEDGTPNVRSVGNPAEYIAPEGFQFLPVVAQDSRSFDPETEELEELEDTIENGQILSGRTRVRTLSRQEQKKRKAVLLGKNLRNRFSNFPINKRAKFYVARAGVKIALEDGDPDGARAVIDSIEPADATEEAIKQKLLSAFD